jgi:hypothetical protein
MSAAFSLVLCSKSSDAAGAPIAGISSQTKRTTAKLKKLKFPNENKFFKKNKYAPCRVEMCEQCDEIIKRASKFHETLKQNILKITFH